MSNTELIRPAAAPEQPTLGEAIAEIVPLAGAIAGYGPPVIFLAGPWVLLALMLAAPFAVLLTLVAAMLAAAALVAALTAAIVGAPYLVVRHLRSHRARRAVGRAHPAPLVHVGTTRVAA